MIRASVGRGYSQGRRGVIIHLGGPPNFGNRARRGIRSQATALTHQGPLSERDQAGGPWHYYRTRALDSQR